MKKFLALFLVIVICIGFTGCAKEEEKVSSVSSVVTGPSVFDGNAGKNSSTANTTTSSTGSSSKNESSSKESSSSSKASSSSSKSSSSKKSSSSPSSSEYKDPIPANAPRIICWGDSITFGMGMARGDSYPGVLQSLLGTKYRVINAGSSGEKSWTIAARQGAYDVTLDRDLVFGADYGSVYLDGVKGPNLIVNDGSVIDLSEWGDSFNNDIPCKNVYINNVKYELSMRGGFNITRENYEKKLVIKKGTKVVLESAKKQQGSYCEIFYVGANDGNPDTDELVGRYKAMAKRQGSDRYIVIIPQWSHKYTEALKAEFGDKALDIREAMCTTNPEKTFNLYVSDADRQRMQEGKMPLIYTYENNPNDTLHLSEEGYKVMAHFIFERGRKLGYWK